MAGQEQNIWNDGFKMGEPQPLVIERESDIANIFRGSDFFDKMNIVAPKSPPPAPNAYHAHVEPRTPSAIGIKRG